MSPVVLPRHRARARGFTLIELLTVIAIIGILTAIVIPVTSSVRTNALKAKTRVMFSNLSSAYEMFRQEYGFYPEMDRSSTSVATDSKYRVNGNDFLFREVLTGRGTVPGTPPTFANSEEGNLAGSGKKAQNRKRRSFYEFPPEMLTDDGLVKDAFGNTDIVVIYDRTGDGLLKKGEDFPSGGPPGVNAALTDKTRTDLEPTMSNDASADFPEAAGLSARVVFYSAGAGRQVTDIVKSWK